MLKNESADILFSKSKSCAKLAEQTQTKLQETLNFNITQPRETFSYIPPILLGSQCEPINSGSLKGYEDAWLIRLTTVEAEKFYPNLLDWINNLRSIEVFF